MGDAEAEAGRKERVSRSRSGPSIQCCQKPGQATRVSPRIPVGASSDKGYATLRGVTGTRRARRSLTMKRDCGARFFWRGLSIGGADFPSRTSINQLTNGDSSCLKLWRGRVVCCTRVDGLGAHLGPVQARPVLPFSLFELPPAHPLEPLSSWKGEEGSVILGGGG